MSLWRLFPLKSVAIMEMEAKSVAEETFQHDKI